uniref:acetolactate synthase large subunit n=1 Tax=Cutleria multifida TaxID=74475 RepID=UPI002E79B520|nr:acetolactate synthase large subunit [Cutleria multifida]WAM62682.1 acetolactate synthase large subunit [Cutleria multifida]
MSIQQSSNLNSYQDKFTLGKAQKFIYPSYSIKFNFPGELFKRYSSMRGERLIIKRQNSKLLQLDNRRQEIKKEQYIKTYGVKEYRKNFISPDLYNLGEEPQKTKLSTFDYLNQFERIKYDGFDEYGEIKTKMEKINEDDENDLVLSWLKQSKMERLSSTDQRYILYTQGKKEWEERQENNKKKKRRKKEKEKSEGKSLGDIDNEIINDLNNPYKYIQEINEKEFHTYTGAFALFDTLVRNKILSVFGYPGGAILPIYDELFFWEKKKFIKHYLVRHEQAATHAADGYSRSTGKVGVCFATSGPGATNLVTGIATAYMDSIPMIIITGQVGSQFLGTDAFQEIDIYGITLSLVKHSYVITEPRFLAQTLTEAIYVSQNGRPGPVLIDIPKNVGLEKIKKFQPFNEITIHKALGWRYKMKTQTEKIYMALYRLSGSSRPLLYVGGGVISSNATAELTEFASRYQIPVTTTLMGKGAFNEEENLSLGMLGMHGTAYANYAIGNCDLLIAVGARFDDRVTGKLQDFACKAYIIHIDVDDSEIGKNKTIGLGITGDVKMILTEFLLIMNRPEYLWYRKPLTSMFKDWASQVATWKKQFPLVSSPSDDLLLPQEVIKRVTDIEPDAIITTDVGQHQMWAAQYMKCKPRNWLSSSGLGTMGFGLPAAIGAAVAHPKKQIICISGDSSFQMNLQELGTISKYNLPIKIIIINNHWQGMVRQWQETFYEQRYSHSSMLEGEPKFDVLSAAYGIKSLYSERHSEILNKLTDTLASKETVLLECNVLEKENCYPMVEPSKANTEMFLTRNLSTTADGLIINKDAKDKKRDKNKNKLSDLEQIQLEYIKIKEQYEEVILEKNNLTPNQEEHMISLIKRVKEEELKEDIRLEEEKKRT